MKASSFRLFPPSPACLPGENLDHVGRTTTAHVASFPSWRRCLGSFAGGGHLLSLESFCFCACLRFISSASSRSRLVVGFSSLADALPPFRSSGCYAAVSRVGSSLLRADTLPPWLVVRVDALPPLLGRRPLHLDVVVSACRFSGWILVRGVGCALCLLCFALLLFVLSLCFLVCVYVFSVFLYF